MTQHLISHHTSPFDSIKQVEQGRDYWSARDLQALMGYTEWRKFTAAIEYAKLSCQNSGQGPADHFVRAAKVVSLASVSQREVADYHLTCCGCYLAAMNNDASKTEVSQAI
jgi:DNA-damage-inducible protein D